MHILLMLSPLLWGTYATGAVLTMRWRAWRTLGREGQSVVASLVWFVYWPLWALSRGARALRGWHWRRNGLPRARLRRAASGTALEALDPSA